MIIGYDAKRIVRNGTGLGSYGRTLINDMTHVVPTDCQLQLYASDKGKEELRRLVMPASNLSFIYPQGRPLRLQRDWWRMYGIVNDLKNNGVQLFHGLSGELPLGIRQAGIKSVVTIHDLIFLRHPEYYKWLDTKIYAWKFRRTCQEADRIIAISECTKKDIMFYGDIPSEKIDLIYQSCGTRFKQRENPGKLAEVRRQYHLPNRYIVNVGSIEARKNILLAVKALSHVPDDVALVIVGRHTPYADKVIRYATRHKLIERLLLLHGVPYEDLPAIYQQAEACVYPSRYEGFGIPIIEAIQSGLPVIACTGSCLMEAGGNDNIYVDPDDVTGMANGICQSLKGTEGREERIARSQKYIQRFEGNDVARQVLEVYKKLL